MFPFIVPIMVGSNQYQTPKCPSCGEKEHRVEICGHCNYKYEETTYTFPFWWLSIIIDVGILYGMFQGLSEVVKWDDAATAIPTMLVIGMASLVAAIGVWFIFAKSNK